MRRLRPILRSAITHPHAVNVAIGLAVAAVLVLIGVAATRGDA